MCMRTKHRFCSQNTISEEKRNFCQIGKVLIFFWKNVFVWIRIVYQTDVNWSTWFISIIFNLNACSRKWCCWSVVFFPYFYQFSVPIYISYFFFFDILLKHFFAFKWYAQIWYVYFLSCKGKKNIET